MIGIILAAGKGGRLMKDTGIDRAKALVRVGNKRLIDVDKYLQQYLGCKKMMYFYSSKGCLIVAPFVQIPFFTAHAIGKSQMKLLSKR